MKDGADPGCSEVGVVFPGELGDARTWSGVPSGIAAGLAAQGVEVVPLSAEVPRAIGVPVSAGLSLARVRRVGLAPPGTAMRRSRLAVKEGSPEFAALRTAVLQTRLRRTRPPRHLVQIGTGYSLPDRCMAVTFEDMTVAQAVQLDLPEWRAQTPRAISKRVDRQRAAYGRAIGCCAASKWAARSIVEDYGTPPERVHVVGFGRNHDPRPVPRDWRTPRFLFVGKEWERKGGPAVLRAFAELRARIPGARLEIVGGHPRLDRPGVVGHGQLGVVASADAGRLERLFESATCCVMPSLYEPFGIVHAEAAAAGVPSIGSTVGGASEPIGPDGGRLVAPGDDAALLSAMLELSSPEVAARMGAAALERSSRFTWLSVAERILNALAGPGPVAQPGDLHAEASALAPMELRS